MLCIHPLAHTVFNLSVRTPTIRNTPRKEDSSLRAQSFAKKTGGNGANSCIVLAQLVRSKGTRHCVTLLSIIPDRKHSDAPKLRLNGLVYFSVVLDMYWWQVALLRSIPPKHTPKHSPEAYPEANPPKWRSFLKVVIWRSWAQIYQDGSRHLLHLGWIPSEIQWLAEHLGDQHGHQEEPGGFQVEKGRHRSTPQAVPRTRRWDPWAAEGPMRFSKREPTSGLVFDLVSSWWVDFFLFPKTA